MREKCIEYICVYVSVRESVHASNTDQGSVGSIFIGIGVGLGGKYTLSASKLKIGYL